jgi:hypothetical protein
MGMSGFDIQALAFLAIAAASAITVAFGMVRLLRSLWGWVFRTGKGREGTRTEPERAAPHTVVGDPKLTATHILAIKSNLDAVSRQLADLELKLRSLP